MNIVHSESPRRHFVYFYERTLQKCPETLGEATSKQAHIKNTSNGYTGMCYVTGGVYTGFPELSSDLKLRAPGARLYARLQTKGLTKTTLNFLVIFERMPPLIQTSP